MPKTRATKSSPTKASRKKSQTLKTLARVPAGGTLLQEHHRLPATVKCQFCQAVLWPQDTTVLSYCPGESGLCCKHGQVHVKAQKKVPHSYNTLLTVHSYFLFSVLFSLLFSLFSLLQPRLAFGITAPPLFHLQFNLFSPCLPSPRLKMPAVASFARIFAKLMEFLPLPLLVLGRKYSSPLRDHPPS